MRSAENGTSEISRGNSPLLPQVNNKLGVMGISKLFIQEHEAIYTEFRFHHCHQTTSALCQSTSPELTVTRHRLSTFGRWAFSIAGPTVWNSLPDSLRNPALSNDQFRQLLKTNLFWHYH